jgi:hypothetical protein
VLGPGTQQLLLKGDGDFLPLQGREHQDVKVLLLALDDDGVQVLVVMEDLQGVLG